MWPLDKFNLCMFDLPDVLVLNSLHIKANGWNCRHNLSKFQLIQDRCLPLQFQDSQSYLTLLLAAVFTLASQVRVSPAASRPTMRILMSFFPKSWLKIEEKVRPIAEMIRKK